MGAFLAFALSPIGRLLMTGALMFSLGGIVGFRAEKKLSDARWYRAQTKLLETKVATLNTRIHVANSAATEDQTRAAEAEKLRADAEQRANDAENRIANTPAFSAADTDELRKLWKSPVRRK